MGRIYHSSCDRRGRVHWSMVRSQQRPKEEALFCDHCRDIERSRIAEDTRSRTIQESGCEVYCAFRRCFFKNTSPLESLLRRRTIISLTSVRNAVLLNEPKSATHILGNHKFLQQLVWRCDSWGWSSRQYSSISESKSDDD